MSKKEKEKEKKRKDAEKIFEKLILFSQQLCLK